MWSTNGAFQPRVDGRDGNVESDTPRWCTLLPLFPVDMNAVGRLPCTCLLRLCLAAEEHAVTVIVASGIARDQSVLRRVEIEWLLECFRLLFLPTQNLSIGAAPESQIQGSPASSSGGGVR